MPRFAADSRFVLLLLGAVVLLAGPRPTAAGNIIVLEDSDSLRSRSSIETRGDRESRKDSDSDWDSEETSKGVRIRIETGDDAKDGNFRVHTGWDSGSTEDIVRFGESIVIEEDEIITGSVVAIGGDIRIEGTVEEDVVALGGTVHLGPHAVVEGDAVILGGRLTKDPGAEVYGEDVGMSFAPVGWFCGIGDLGGTLVRTTILGSTFLFLLLSGIVFHLMFPSRILAIATVLRSRIWASLFAGVALHVLFWPVVGLLTVIVIGIPIAILLPVVFLLLSIVGSVVAAALLGGRLQGADLESHGGWMRSLFLGLFLLTGWLAVGDALASVGGGVGMAGQFLVLVGLGTNFTLATIGMGAAVLSRFGGRNPVQVDPPETPPVPPLPPPPDPLSAGV